MDFEEIFRQLPSVFFKSLGLGTVCHALGGLMAGIQSLDDGDSNWPAVNQGSFMMAIDLSRFASPETFKRQMDHFVTCIGDKRSPLVSGRDGLATVIACDAAYRSFKTDQKVRVESA